MQNYNIFHILLFVVVYFAYGSSYLLRMPFGVIKGDILKHYGISSDSSAYIDLSFLLPYAFVSLTMGSLVEFFGPRLTLAFGLFFSVLAMCALPFCDSFLSFVSFIFMIGASQSLCWPSSCALITNLFDKDKSAVLGLFGTSCFLGSIVGKILALEMKATYSWSMIFLAPSAVVGVMSCIVLAGSKCTPKTPASKSNEMQFLLLPETFERTFKNLSCWQVFMLPGVVEISFTIFFVKSIRFMFMFWLPLYLYKALNYTPIHAGYASLSLDLGGIFGSCLMGLFSDKCAKGRDMYVCLLSIIICSLVVTTFYFAPNASWTMHTLLLMVLGSMNGGAEVLLCGSVAAKLGKRHLGSSTSAVTSLTGIVNGMGSLGTVLQVPIVAIFSAWFGWQSILVVIIGFLIAASFCAVRANGLMSHHQYVI